MTPDEEKGTMYVLALLDLLDARRVPDEGTSRDPLEGANCHLCGNTADNFHVSDALWERVGLGSAQACFKCFRIAAWHKGIWPEHSWEVSLA